MKTIYFVIPCYNEEEVLNETAKRLSAKYKQLIAEDMVSTDSKIVFVDDGSKDNTWRIIEELYNANSIFCGVKLSRNRGHQNALLAGVMTTKKYFDAVITMDADLQDDIDAVDGFIQKYNEGCDIVYGVRKSRIKDKFFKRNTAQMFYKIMSSLGVDIVYNHADYRLMSNRAVNELESFEEVNLFLRGIVPLIGFKSDKVYYERNERFAGESKYPLKKMISFAVEGITSFSIKPIRFIFYLGFIIFILSLLTLIYSFVRFLIGYDVNGWSVGIKSLWSIGGLQILCIGIVGEYIGKIYLETKRRPKYIIDVFIKKP